MVQVCLGVIYAWGTFVPMLKASKSELALMLRPDVLEIDQSTHTQWMEKARTFKAAQSLATGPAKSEAKAAWTAFLKDQVEPNLKVAPEKWDRYFSGFSAIQAKSIFSTGLGVFAFVMIISGRLQDRIGPRWVAILGCVLLGLGYLVASFWTSQFWWVWFWVGVVGGIGTGCAYVCPLAACLKWYPEAKGLITGLAVAGFGAGAYVFINLAGDWAGLLARGGIPLGFQVFGLVFLTVGVTGALLLRNPEPGDVPTAMVSVVPSQAPDESSMKADLTQGETVRTPIFWLMWLAFVLSAGAGLMVISSLKDYGVSEEGLPEASAERALGLLALFNGLGRIFWGTLGQAWGLRRSLISLMVLQAAMLFGLQAPGSSVYFLAIAGCWAGFMFGGNLSLFPQLTADRFGLRHMGANYGLMFTGYGLGGVFGPMLAGWMWDSLHSYRAAFLIAAIASLVAAILVTRVGRLKPLSVRA